MRHCAADVKTPASSYLVVACSIGFIPTAIVSSLVVIICIVKNPYEGMKTPLNTLMISSSVASLLSVPVNVMRIWHHAWRAAGVDLHEVLPSAKPAFSSCHVVWFTSQFVGAFICLESLIYVRWKDNFLERSSILLRNRFYSFVTLIIWISSFGFGLGSLWAGMAKMKIVQAAINTIIVLIEIYIYCCTPQSSKKRQMQAEIVNNSSDTVRGCEESQGIHLEEQCDIEEEAETIQRKSLPPAIATECKTENTTEDLTDEIQWTYSQIHLFAFCSILSSIVLAFYIFADSISCSAMLWMKDIGSLCLHAFLALESIMIIRCNTYMKKAVKRILKMSRDIYPENA